MSDKGALISSAEDYKERLSGASIDEERKIVELDLRREELASNKQDRDERKRFATKIFWMMTCFLFIVLLSVFLHAIPRVPFNLSDPVLIALLTTSSAEVIGVFLVVARYLFKSK